jgi:putative ABC transport system permease protein
MNIFLLIWKGVTRKKIRTGLTLLSVFVAFLMFGLLTALDDWFSGRLLEGNYSERLIVQSATGIPLPMGFFEKIKAMDGVVPETVAYNSQIGGYYQKPENGFFQLATNAESFLHMEERYYELAPEQKESWLNDRTGAVIGRELADRFGWKIGDRVPVISSIHPRADGSHWELNIRGIFDSKRDGVQTDMMALHFDYLAEGRGGIYDVFWYALNVRDPRQANSIAKRIDDEFRNSSTSTSTHTLASLSSQFSSQLGNFGMISSLILAAVFFTTLLVTGNTMMQSFRERMHELAMLKALGYSGQVVLSLMLAESLSIVLLGGLPGVGLLWLLQGAAQKMFSGLYVRPAVILEGVGLMLMMGLLVGLIPAVQARRLTIVEALRRR